MHENLRNIDLALVENQTLKWHGHADWKHLRSVACTHPALAAHGGQVSGAGDQPALAFSTSALMPLDLWLGRYALAGTKECKEHTYNCLNHTVGTGGGKSGLNCSDAPAFLRCLQDSKNSTPIRVQEPSLCSRTMSCLGVLGAAAYPSLTTPALAQRLRC